MPGPITRTLSPRGRTGTGPFLMAMLGCLGAACAVEAAAGLTTWARLGHLAVGWCALAAAVRRAHDAGRTWRLPASIAALGVVSMGCFLMGAVHAAFDQDHGGWFAAAAAAGLPCLWLSGVLAFSLPRTREAVTGRRLKPKE